MTAKTSPARPRKRRRKMLVFLFGVVVLGFDAWLLHRYIAGTDAAPPLAGAEPQVTSPAAPTSPTVTSPVPTTAPAAPQPAPRPQVADWWVTDVAGRTQIPARALMAYANAQLATEVPQPNCHVSWTMLAAIGAVESGHGSHGGAILLPDGTTSVPIIGPALDGTHNTKAIPATAQSQLLHGDPLWDHAVGPMQFLPSTWATWGVSATGGVPNPSDIDDAALTAARYLCARDRDLATPQGWQAAIHSYNAPDSYAAKVTDLANQYARDSLPTNQAA